jgi:hypothetical protein
MIERSGFDILLTHADYPTLTKESSFYLSGLDAGEGYNRIGFNGLGAAHHRGPLTKGLLPSTART